MYLTGVLMAVIWVLNPNATGAVVSFIVGAVFFLFTSIVSFDDVPPKFRKSYEILPSFLHEKYGAEHTLVLEGDALPHVNVSNFMGFYNSHKYNSRFQEELSEKLLEYYVQEDVAAFRLLKHTKR